MNNFKRIKKTVSGWFGKYINGTKGVISLFLAILMVPFVTIAGALINAGRINSAVAIFDEALCNASNSTLGTYDKFLRTRFGMLAISQDYPDMGVDYTVEKFITETFSYYMEENCKALSNTYMDITASAVGIYPLADREVLLSQTLEASKYTVPMKMVIDGFNLDDLLGKLTGDLSLLSNAFNLVSSSVDTVTAYDELNEKLEALIQEIDDCSTAYEEYETAFSNFKAAVDDYNALVDQRNNAVAQCEAAVANAQSNLSLCQSKFDSLSQKSQSIVNELNALKNEKDSEGKPVDNSEKIAALEETYKDTLEEYRAAESDLNNAKRRLPEAQANLQSTKDYYDGLLAGQRTTTSEKKSDYVTEITELMASVQSMNGALTSAQGAAASLISKGASTITGVVNVGFEVSKAISDSNIKDLEAQRNAAASEGNTEIVEDYNQQITACKDSKTVVGDVQKGLTSGTDKLDAVTALEKFAESEADYTSYLQNVYLELATLKANVLVVQIPTGISKMSSVASYFYEFNFPVSTEYVEALLDGLFQQLAGSAFFTVIKAIAGFITAVFEMFTEIGYDHDLVSTIDTGKYSNIGGLPSSKSQDSFKSDYLETDREKSEEYKALLGAYSGNGSSESSVSATDVAISAIMENVKTISDTVNEEWTWRTFIGHLKIIVDAIIDITKQIGVLISSLTNALKATFAPVGDAVSSTLSSAYRKMLLVGYIGYNTANRTTYMKSSLTGSKYETVLPSGKAQNADGYAFYGAETEYILFGTLSEINNQRAAYYSILGLRLIYDAFVVWGNAEAQAVATAAGTVTFGVGYYVVLVLWMVAEAFMDSMFLCHGGNIRYIKTRPYLSIEGIPDLVNQISKLTLTNAMKEDVSIASSEALNGMTNSVDDPEKRAEINSQFYDSYSGELDSEANLNSMQLTDEKLKLFTFDYTKVMMMYMLIFKSSDTLLKRLSDIIQMEATWHEVSTNFSHTFDLGKSYTYLRASGSFSSNQFIKIAENDPTSKERIVYRGY